MMRASLYSLFIVSLSLLTACSTQETKALQQVSVVKVQSEEALKPRLSEHELYRISNRIYFNETASKPENLLKWHDGENFLSLGIGHFIWYPQDVIDKRFDETFPSLVDHLEKHAVPIPFWLLSARHIGAPWPDKDAFEASQNDPELRELKRILLNTKELQTLFFLDRMQRAIPVIVNRAPEEKKQRIIHNYNTLAQTDNGWYALIDYLNFKGSGLKESERYNDQGWGLYQVLDEMRPSKPGLAALEAFSKSAKSVLERRIFNAPEENDEYRWLAGWKKRVSSYAHTL